LEAKRRGQLRAAALMPLSGRLDEEQEETAFEQEKART